MQNSAVHRLKRQRQREYLTRRRRWALGEVPSVPCHMIAALLELDHGRTVMTPLPPLSLCNLHKGIGFVILGAFFPAVPLAVTEAADLGLTSAAFAILSATSGLVKVDIGRLDPFSAAFTGAVDAVLGRVLLIFTVPLHLELDVEQLVDMLERDMISGATTGRHVLRIRDRQHEDTFQAVMTHDVAAG